MLDIWTDLCLFLNRDCKNSSSNTETSKDRFEFYSIFKRSVQTEKYIDFWHKLIFNSGLVFRWYQYTGWNTEMILFRESYCAPCARISVHRLRYRNDIIQRELLCPVCKDISTQAEIQKWYYSERVIVPCVQGWNRGWGTCSFFV